MLQWQNWVVASETVWLPKQRIFIIWFFIEKSVPAPDMGMRSMAAIRLGQLAVEPAC